MISIYDSFGYKAPDVERYRNIREAGFDGVLLWWSDGFGRGPDYRHGVDYARGAGLAVENIHTPVQEQNKLSFDDLEGESLFKCYLSCVDDCSAFDIPTMVVHLPDNEYPLTALGCERIEKIVERAEKLDINVAMENVRNIVNVEYVLDHISSSKVGFCYDSCHHANYVPDIDLLARYGDRLMAMHLHDNGGVRGQHQLPFDGNVRWDEVMNKINAVGYRGSTALEPMNWGYEALSEQQFLNRAYEKAARLDGMRNI